MVEFKQAETDDELVGILDLQQSNLAAGLTSKELEREGFVTVSHSLELLRELNDIERHVIAIKDGRIAGYVLAMTKASRHRIPILFEMFAEFDRLSVFGHDLRGSAYMVIGQVCVAKEFRGQGVFEGLYREYQRQFSTRYPIAITEVASSNTRSLAAHRKLGFREVAEYTCESGTRWVIVAWDWNAGQ